VTAIGLSFAIALVLNGAFFAVAAARRTDVVTDLSYSLTFALLAIVLPFTGARATSQLVASLLVLIWAVRLGSYLFRRILRMKVDHRFDDMRDKPLRFARFWLLQAITVAGIMLPVSYLLDRDDAPGEILLWWGVFLYAVPFLHGAAFAVVIGPVFITLLLLFVSGIPLLERSADEKYGDDPAYREYKRRTSILVPLPPSGR
jgi:steroid 5-alpha reductase family enzyme